MNRFSTGFEQERPFAWDNWGYIVIYLGNAY